MLNLDDAVRELRAAGWIVVQPEARETSYGREVDSYIGDEFWPELVLDGHFIDYPIPRAENWAHVLGRA